MQDDKLKTEIAKLRIIADYDAGRLKPAFHKKTTDYIRSQGLTYQLVIKEAVSHLDTCRYSRGPSPHHWKKDTEVYEFLEYIDSLDMYVKFSVNISSPDGGTQLESYHKAEKDADETWQNNN
ncbi:hypothetical protein [Levilactobacillus yonginensis]|uniref:hypothetical protein n=1 Tax=Levilactobacillus yonginensis TaxID=1054041 RepID=UPI00345D8D0C